MDRTDATMLMGLEGNKQGTEQASERLKAAGECWRSISPSVLESIPAGVYVCGAGGKILWHNRRAGEVWGCTPRIGDTYEQFCGSLRLYLPDGRLLPHDETPMAEVLKTGTPAHNREVAIERPDGSTVFVLMNIDPLLDDDGRQVGAINCFVDITGQKTAEEELRRQETELRRITDAIPALVSYVDNRQHFRVANRAYAEWFDLPRDQVEGRHIREVIGETVYEAIRPQVEQALAGKPVRFEGPRLMPDGSERQVDASYIPRFGRKGQVIGFYAFVNDMTERYRTLADLRSYTALLETVLDVVPAAVWVSEDVKGSVIFGSRYAAELFRVPPDENLSRTPRDGKGPTHWWFCKDGEPLAIDESPLRRSLRGEVVRGEELDLVYDDGGRITLLIHSAPIFDSDGRPRGAVSAAMDISRRVRTHEALRARTAELEAIMKTVPAIVWLARGSDAEYVEGSRYSAELFKIPPGRNQSRTGPAADRPSHYRMLGNGVEVPDTELPLQRAARGEEVREEELEVLFDDGETVPILINASPLRDETGRITGSLGVGIDIRERKRAEERQRLLMAELDHRVKNMLATVQAMVARTASERSSVDEFAMSLNGRIRAMARAHEQLAENRWEGVSLRVLVENELQPYGSEDRIRTEGPDLVLSAKAATSLALVLHELSTNAAKHGALSRDDGTVSIVWTIGGEPEQMLRLGWEEAGGPPVSEPRSRGFGSVLIERIVAYEFEAGVSLRWAPEGLQAAFDIPLSKVTAEASRRRGRESIAGKGKQRSAPASEQQ